MERLRSRVRVSGEHLVAAMITADVILLVAIVLMTALRSR